MSEQKWITITVPFSTEPCSFKYDSGGTCERQSATAVFACRGGVQITVRTRDVVTGIHSAWPTGEPADMAKRLAEIEARHAAAEAGSDAVAGAHDDRGFLLREVREALAALAEVDDILTAAEHPATGPTDTIGARVGRAVDDRDVPGEDDARISQAATREGIRAHNTTKGAAAERENAEWAARTAARAAGLAAYRADRRARKGTAR